MGANTDLAMDAETRQRIDDLRRDVQRDRDRFNAKTLGLRFLGQPVSHPHQGMIWVDDPGYLGGPADWTPHWTRYGGVWLCPIYVPNEDRTDVVSYEVFFDGIKEEACRKFRQHACEVAALLQRLGCELSVSICRESELVRTLFERNRTELHWEENEEPGHPETKSHIARLKDIYGHTESFLIDLLDEFAPPSLAQHLQVAQEIEVDRQDGTADDESSPTTMPNAETLALRNEVESGADAVVVPPTGKPAEPESAVGMQAVESEELFKPIKPSKYASKDTPIPKEYKDTNGKPIGPLQGNETELSKAIGQNRKAKPIYLQSRHLKRLFIHEIGHRDFHVYFMNQSEFDRASKELVKVRAKEPPYGATPLQATPNDSK